MSEHITSVSGRTWPADRYAGESFAIGQRVWHHHRGPATFLGRDDWDPATSYVRFANGDEARITHALLSAAPPDDTANEGTTP
jgi:hypothetical protein